MGILMLKNDTVLRTQYDGSSTHIYIETISNNTHVLTSTYMHIHGHADLPSPWEMSGCITVQASVILFMFYIQNV